MGALPANEDQSAKAVTVPDELTVRTDEILDATVYSMALTFVGHKRRAHKPRNGQRHRGSLATLASGHRTEGVKALAARIR
jgi:hypothetical protein